MATNDYSHLVDETLEYYYKQFPSVQEAAKFNAHYAAQVALVRQTLHTVDTALEAEGIDPYVRQLVVRTVIFGPSDPVGAQERVVPSGLNGGCHASD